MHDITNNSQKLTVSALATSMIQRMRNLTLKLTFKNCEYIIMKTLKINKIKYFCSLIDHVIHLVSNYHLNPVSINIKAQRVKQGIMM